MIPLVSQEVKKIENLEAPIQFLKGVGPKRVAFFKKLGIQTIRDLLWHFPRRHEDRRTFLSIAQAPVGQKVTVRGVITGSSIFRAKTGTIILQVTVRDSTGVLTALWFNQPYMKKWFPIGQEIILYGMAEQVGRKIQMAAPDFEMVPHETSGTPVSLHMGRIVPIYPATSGLHQRELRNAMAEGLKMVLPTLKDSLPTEIRERHHLVDLATALKRIHFPPVPEAVATAQERVAFDELLSFQLALAMRRKNLEARAGITHQTSGDLVTGWRQGLPFQLTAGQEKAIEEISKDMAASRPMNRLLQGEVGSGKTVVASYAIVVAHQSGFQSVMMAPTEVLARQHAITLTRFLAPANIEVRLLTGSLEKPQRVLLANDLKEGDAPLLVGTHAVLEPWVTFKKLGLVIIDEQQKFGVDQRNTISAKGHNSDILILTATPIPRTLALTLYGEMEISTITERPAGRQPTRTIWLDSTRREEAYAFVRSELEAGHQGYVVCPRIGTAAPMVEDLFSSPAGSSAASATELFREYQRIFAGHRLALLHGRMSGREQKSIFAAFKQGEIQLLIATQIIEVGVDVSNATVMVIESATRFGLAQLHQLRGRVGRGKSEAVCILMADPSQPEGAQRLRTLVESEDAFKIAEEDLRLRGPGELLGKRQAGIPDLKCLEWASRGPWLEVTREEAEALLAKDPTLSSSAGILLRKEMNLRFPELVPTVS